MTTRASKHARRVQEAISSACCPWFLLILIATLTVPIWGWFAVYFIATRTPGFIRRKIEEQRRKFYCGYNISENNTARPARPLLLRCMPRRRPRPIESSLAIGQDESNSPCRLLSLPYELRERIWREILVPSNQIYIKHNPGDSRLSAFYNDSYYQGDPDRPESDVPPIASFSRHVSARRYTGSNCRNLTKLLKLNHSFYHETSALLYEANTFGFAEPPEKYTPGRLFIAFSRTILPERLSLIRHIRLNVAFYWCYAAAAQEYRLSLPANQYWPLACDLLKQMSLTTLHIRIQRGLYRQPFDPSRGLTQERQRAEVKGQTPESKVLRQLVGVKASKTFTVEAEWSGEAVGDLSGTAFELKLIDVDPAHVYKTV